VRPDGRRGGGCPRAGSRTVLAHGPTYGAAIPGLFARFHPIGRFPKPEHKGLFPRGAGRPAVMSAGHGLRTAGTEQIVGRTARQRCPTNQAEVGQCLRTVRPTGWLFPVYLQSFIRYVACPNRHTRPSFKRRRKACRNVRRLRLADRGHGANRRSDRARALSDSRIISLLRGQQLKHQDLRHPAPSISQRVHRATSPGV